MVSEMSNFIGAFGRGLVIICKNDFLSISLRSRREHHIKQLAHIDVHAALIILVEVMTRLSTTAKMIEATLMVAFPIITVQ